MRHYAIACDYFSLKEAGKKVWTESVMLLCYVMLCCCLFRWTWASHFPLSGTELCPVLF